MRIREEIKRLGYFWLPSKPNRKVPGTLSILDGGIIGLEVLHRIGERSKAFGDDAKRIVGQIEKDDFVTLDQCSYADPGGSGGILTHSFSIKRASTGVTYKEDESPRFNTLTFSIEGINEWIGRSSIEVDYQFKQDTVILSYGPLEHISLNLNNGIRLLIKPYMRFDGRFHTTEEFEINPKTDKFGISSKTDFELVSQEARELDEFIAVAQKITAFLCLAIDEIVCLDSMSATSNNPRRDIEEGATRMDPRNIYYSSWPYSKNEPKIDPHGMLFGFKAMPKDAERIINKWIEICEQIEPALDLYFLAKMGAQPSSEAKFLALAQSLEACHRRINSGRRDFGKRLEDITQPFEDIIGNQTTREELIRKIVNTRNYLAHYDLRLESKAAKDEDLSLLCLKMEALFQLHILRLIDFNLEEIDSIVANCPQSIVWRIPDSFMNN